MKEISQEVPDHVPDSMAKIVREKWIADGKARQTPRPSEGTKCRAQTG
jgi:hypothetical protein